MPPDLWPDVPFCMVLCGILFWVAVVPVAGLVNMAAWIGGGAWRAVSSWLCAPDCVGPATHSAACWCVSACEPAFDRAPAVFPVW